MSGRLFKLSATVTISKLVPGSFFDTQGHNAIVITSHRIAGKIDKHLGKEPNTCEVKIYNLAEKTRSAVQTKPLHVRVDAGYDGVLQRIFEGDLLYADSQREGASWVTVMQLGDGARAYNDARVNRSLGSGTTARQALAEAAKAMGLALPSNVLNAPELLAQYAAGVSLNGPASSAMTKILDRFGYDWSTQDGRLQILKPTDAAAGTAIVLATGSGPDGHPNTGVIGSPAFGAPGAEKKPPTLKVKALVYPDVSPGRMVQVSSKSVNGAFKVQKVTHSFDTRAKGNYSEIEATDPDSVIVTPTLAQVMNQILDSLQAGLHTTLPGEVQSFNAATQRAIVQPLIKRGYYDGSDTRQTERLPCVVECPVAFPGSSSGGMTFPIKAGDTVALAFCEASLDRWLALGGEVDPQDDRRHDMSDAIVIPGVRAVPLPSGAYDASAVVVWGAAVKLGSSAASHAVVVQSALDAFVGVLAGVATTAGPTGGGPAITALKAALEGLNTGAGWVAGTTKTTAE